MPAGKIIPPIPASAGRAIWLSSDSSPIMTSRFDFHTDGKEENCHEAVIHPQEQRLGDFQRAYLDNARCIEKGRVERAGGCVFQNHGHYGRDQQQDTARRFEAEKLLESCFYHCRLLSDLRSV